MRRGTVHESGGGVYVVALDDGRIVEASLRGRLKQEARAGDRVAVGDRVGVLEVEPGAWTVEEVEERESQLVRRTGPGRRPKVVAANVDRLVIVVAAAEPAPRVEVIDRLLVLAEADGIAGVVVVNKTDLPGAEAVVAELRETYRPAGYPVLATSAVTGEGLAELERVLCDGVSALVGPSGVGKSSLLNAIEPDLALRTGAVSGKIRRGRHTTVSARLIPLGCGGAVADTPGFAEVGLYGMDVDDLLRCFPELTGLDDSCRFRGCRHGTEPGCAVRAAEEDGAVSPERMRSYRTLLAELEASRHDR